MTETQLSARIREALETLGFWVIRLNVSGRRSARAVANGEPGLPDLYLPGLGHLEVKRPGQALNANQIKWHRRAKAAGVRVHTVDSVGEAVVTAKNWASEMGMP